ncbi:indole-3-glycerol phosphate synthase TrpC [Campylobacter mucosalis]|uniref:Indole-3-glycerol phosphate synthase n=1 Tax=Campylobacter mucosalis CCUG 21559 TaxID=1032067 RepID=A0A6G5QHM5_9BACT|nr:indole-3-glycerol phosphate synthase TrpC [Campylobacter mucosalis]QCD45132.1 indole-3-glycerol phosphate synthase [Campylobacter mucosalis CCUG 21559]
MILDDIILKTKDDLEQRKINYPIEWLESAFKSNPYKPRAIYKALKKTPENSIHIIAEVKKASPSKGVIRENFDPLFIAKEYEKAGVNAISVLTEPHFFKGNLEYLTNIRRYTATPLLRKDFIIDKYQIIEALIYGADFVLLIAKALSKGELKALHDYALSIGLEVLVETHDEDDLKKALEINANIIGINHRNLENFKMDMSLSGKLVPLIPKDKIVVAESGLYSHEQLDELSKVGVDSFLIGEHFMRQDSIVNAVKTIKGER